MAGDVPQARPRLPGERNGADRQIAHILIHPSVTETQVRLPGLDARPHRALVRCGEVCLDAWVLHSDTDTEDTDTTPDPELVVSAMWTDDGNVPTDTDGDGFPDTGCGDFVTVSIDDPLGETAWLFGMVETGSPSGWYGEDCYVGYASYNICHSIAPGGVVNEVTSCNFANVGENGESSTGSVLTGRSSGPPLHPAMSRTRAAKSGRMRGYTRSRLPEPLQPSVGHPDEIVALQVVNPLTAPLLHAKESGVPQDPQVPRDGRPAVVEALGDVARRHLPPTGVDDDEDVPARLVGQGPKDALERFELCQTISGQSGDPTGEVREAHACEQLLHALPRGGDLGMLVRAADGSRLPGEDLHEGDVPLFVRLPEDLRGLVLDHVE